MEVSFPFRLDGRGRVADATRPEHVRHLIEQLLFTSPGERVNRPDFGCGLLREVFGPGSPEERVATEFLVRQALEHWLGEEIEPGAVELRHQGERLFVMVEYVDRRSRQKSSVTFEVTET